MHRHMCWLCWLLAVFVHGRHRLDRHQAQLRQVHHLLCVHLPHARQSEYMYIGAVLVCAVRLLLRYRRGDSPFTGPARTRLWGVVVSTVNRAGLPSLSQQHVQGHIKAQSSEDGRRYRGAAGAARGAAGRIARCKEGEGVHVRCSNSDRRAGEHQHPRRGQPVPCKEECAEGHCAGWHDRDSSAVTLLPRAQSCRRERAPCRSWEEALYGSRAIHIEDVRTATQTAAATACRPPSTSARPACALRSSILLPWHRSSKLILHPAFARTRTRKQTTRASSATWTTSGTASSRQMRSAPLCARPTSSLAQPSAPLQRITGLHPPAPLPPQKRASSALSQTNNRTRSNTRP